jgi:hypothetical protein
LLQVVGTPTAHGFPFDTNQRLLFIYAANEWMLTNTYQQGQSYIIDDYKQDETTMPPFFKGDIYLYFLKSYTK